ncbi:MAG TPA: beta-propeller fold lactonase family protein [Nitrospira sp.]|nr:beta-propeller fold lactonase family protein [Nitrospira sp.]
MIRTLIMGVLVVAVTLSGWGTSSVFANDDWQWPTVYTMSNDPDGNAVLAFRQHGDTLVPAGSFPTGGKGSGGGLGNQGALALSDDGDELLVVNPGSDDISVFQIHGRHLRLVDRVPSGGTRPISLAIHDDYVYVLNAGGAGNIAGFEQTHQGKLKLIAGSIRPLSGANTAPAQISFTPAGDMLVVTEKATQIIDTYAVDEDGVATGPVSQPSHGTTPFGFSFTRRGVLVVSEAFGGAPNGSAVSSYRLRDGALTVLSGSVPTTQTAACWIVITRNEKFAYASNTGSGNISSYRVGRSGRLVLQEAVATPTGAGPIDMALNRNSRFLYVLNSGSHSIDVFHVNRANGRLTTGTGVSGLPNGANGLIAQ